jgi:hypothetical protein
MLYSPQKGTTLLTSGTMRFLKLDGLCRVDVASISSGSGDPPEQEMTGTARPGNQKAGVLVAWPTLTGYADKRFVYATIITT